MRRYCTLFDRNYLARGLALHRSLMRHGGDFTLHVLCLDESVRKALCVLDLPRLEPIPMQALEDWDSELHAARSSRGLVEFYFTCKPSLLAFLLKRGTGFERLAYLDSDLFFFSDAALVEQECADSPLALTPHRFSARNSHLRRFGLFNAGWVRVGNNAEAWRFVSWWRDRCMEWCRIAVEDTRYGDQKYLDQVPGLFPGTKIVLHPGVNAGPWNLDPRRVELSAGAVLIERSPLVFFHFHLLRRILLGLYDSGLYEYGVEITPAIRRGIYQPYLAELADCERQLRRLPDIGQHYPRDSALRRLAQTARALAHQSTVSAAS